MFEFADMMVFGRVFESEGKTWIALRSFEKNLVMAVEKDVPMPAPVMLVEMEDLKKEQKEIVPSSLTTKKGRQVPGEV